METLSSKSEWDSRAVPVSLKYAVVERERRYLLARLPGGVSTTREIVDRYVTNTRLRLREMRESDGTVDPQARTQGAAHRCSGRGRLHQLLS